MCCTLCSWHNMQACTRVYERDCGRELGREGGREGGRKEKEAGRVEAGIKCMYNVHVHVHVLNTCIVM